MEQKSRHCRRLFPDEGDGGTPEISAYDAAESQMYRDKYNFDFLKGVPLEGRYEWTRVAPPSPPLPAVGGRRPRGPAVDRGAPPPDAAPEEEEEGGGAADVVEAEEADEGSVEGEGVAGEEEKGEAAGEATSSVCDSEGEDRAEK